MSNYKNKENKKEITGIYNTTFNEKSATPIKTDIELIEDEIIETIAMYVRGWHIIHKDKGLGAEHIKIHLEKNNEGYISIEELLNLGKSIREYTSIFKEPFIDKKGGKVFEWENNKNIRFRCIIAEVGSGTDLPSYTHSNNVIITFYSDRNFKERMEFKNIKVTKHYKSIQHDQSNQERLGNSQPIHSSQSKLKKLTKVDKSKLQEKGRSR